MVLLTAVRISVLQFLINIVLVGLLHTIYYGGAVRSLETGSAHEQCGAHDCTAQHSHTLYKSEDLATLRLVEAFPPNPYYPPIAKSLKTMPRNPGMVLVQDGQYLQVAGDCNYHVHPPAGTDSEGTEARKQEGDCPIFF